MTLSPAKKRLQISCPPRSSGSARSSCRHKSRALGKAGHGCSVQSVVFAWWLTSQKGADNLNTLPHPFAWYGHDMVRSRKSCELTTGISAPCSWTRFPHLCPLLWQAGPPLNVFIESCIKLCQSTTKLTASANSSRVWVLTSSKALPRRTWVESTMGCMAGADLLWKGRFFWHKKWWKQETPEI